MFVPLFLACQVPQRRHVVAQVDASHKVGLCHSCRTAILGNENSLYNGLQGNLPELCSRCRYYIFFDFLIEG